MGGPCADPPGPPAWPTPGADPRAPWTRRRSARARALRPLAGASLLAVAAALPAVADNSGASVFTLAGAAFGVPERSALEPPELRPAIDSCLRVRELSFARVTSAGPGPAGHAQVRLAAEDRVWDCVARLDGTGLLSLRRLDSEPGPAAAAGHASPTVVAPSHPAGRPMNPASAGGEPPFTRPPASPAPGRLTVNQRDVRSTLGRPGSNSSLGFSFAPSETPDLSIKLTGGAEHIRRPEAAGGPFRFMTPTAWRETQNWDVGLDLALAQNRLRYQGRRAASFEGRAPAGGPGLFDRSHDLDEPGLLDASPAYAGRPALATSSTSSHRLDVDILRREGLRLSAYGALSDLAQEGAFFTSFRPFAPPEAASAAAVFQSRVREFGGRLDIQRLKLSLSQREEHRLNRDAGKLQAKAVYGPVALTASRRTLERVAPANGRRTSRDAVDARLDLSLEARRLGPEGEGGARRLIPSTAWVSAGQAQTAYSWLEGDPSDAESTYGAGVSWSWENGDTEFSFNRGQAVSRRLSLAPSDAEEWSVDFSHTAYGRFWDATAYGYASSARTDLMGSGSSETFFGGGVTASLRAERWPDASVSVALDRFDALYEGFLEESSDRSLDLRLDLDFSKHLLKRAEGPAPYLTAGFYTQRRLSRESQSLRTSDWGHAVHITFGAPF